MGKTQEMQRLIRHYRDETGEVEIDMHKVAEWAIKNGWPVPKPTDPVDLLASQFTNAARQETRTDQENGQPYRANHSISVQQGGQQLHLWIDIDEAPRSQMLKSLINRREQMVSDGLMLTYDAEHWNRVNPDQEPIQLDLDLTWDIEWRRNAPDEDGEVA